jgi:hypothetical protein
VCERGKTRDAVSKEPGRLYDLAVAPTGARDSTELGTAARRARWWHLATFVAAAFGVGLQLWIEFDPAPNPDRPEFSTPIRLWNVLSYFTVWSNG